ncbi:MAG: type 1 pili tip component [Halieaceae bacterium]|jgi:hypothetical protein|nr:type 1 pili tip component [Halieaceae bacterium]
MRATDLIEKWETEAAGELDPEACRVHLPLESVARLDALAEMFPPRTREQLVSELLAMALDQVAASFPYIEGDEIIARDEEGDPVFQDVGHTPRYLELVRKHLQKLTKAGAD